MSRLSLLPVAAVTVALAAPALAATEAERIATQHHQVRVESVAEGLVHPWGIAFLPDGRYLVTERNDGRLRIGTPDGDLSDPVEGVPEIFRYEGDTPRSQAGLFDVKLHPDFADNQLVYLSLSKPTERGAGTAVVRGRLVEDGGAARLDDVETVFEMKPEDQDSSGLHFGGRMAFHPEDGTLHLGIGERRNISRSQDEDDQAGAIIRVTDAGDVPEDNPFRGEDDKDPYIFASGIRNPQALGFQPGSNQLWVADHGPLGGDKLLLVEAGENYGWPYLTAGSDYSGAPLGVGTQHAGMRSSVRDFDETLAPSGLAFYTGEAFPNWQGHMLIGAMAGTALVRVALQDGQVVEEEWMLTELDRRIRDVVIAEDGAVWVITEHEDGEVLRITPADAPVAATPQ